MVPTGWDSWGKINVLRDGFEPGKIGESWDVSLERLGPRKEEGVVMDGEEKGIEEIWSAVVPDFEEGMKVSLRLVGFSSRSDWIPIADRESTRENHPSRTRTRLPLEAIGHPNARPSSRPTQSFP